MDVYRLPQYDAEILTSERSLSEYFESAVRHYGGEPKIVSNWIINDLLRMIKDINLSPELLNLTPVYLADIIKMVEDGYVNTTTAKNLFSLVQKSNNSPREIVEKENLGLVRNENSIKLIVEKILNAHPEEVQSYKSGRENLLGWFLGQVMRETAGKADPKVARRILINELTNR
jgi:aspartyl-tRNA(Asn)/glutamyl-tRNA(Gln) amidotransferase subunit B